jgi:peptidoglycan hydrolase-like amidase
VLDGKRLSRLVLWGAGTGHGLGFARYGALGQAALGADWKEILRRYFPKLDIRDPSAKPAVPAGVGPYKRTLNFRKQKPKK